MQIFFLYRQLSRILEGFCRTIRGYVGELPVHRVSVYDRGVSCHVCHAHEDAHSDARHHEYGNGYAGEYGCESDGAGVRGNEQYHHDCVGEYEYENGHAGACVYAGEHGHDQYVDT